MHGRKRNAIICCDCGDALAVDYSQDPLCLPCLKAREETLAELLAEQRITDGLTRWAEKGTSRR